MDVPPVGLSPELLLVLLPEVSPDADDVPPLVLGGFVFLDEGFVVGESGLPPLFVGFWVVSTTGGGATGGGAGAAVLRRVGTTARVRGRTGAAARTARPAAAATAPPGSART